MEKSLVKTLDYVAGKAYRTSLVVGMSIHGAFVVTQALIGNDYVKAKAQQFVEHPLITSIEIAVPFAVAYGVSKMKK